MFGLGQKHSLFLGEILRQWLISRFTSTSTATRVRVFSLLSVRWLN
jgi:hypothetical protein